MGVLHSKLMLYEAYDVHEVMTVHNRILILVGVVCPDLENSVHSNVMGIIEMSMYPTL